MTIIDKLATLEEWEAITIQLSKDKKTGLGLFAPAEHLFWS